MIELTTAAGITPLAAIERDLLSTAAETDGSVVESGSARVPNLKKFSLNSYRTVVYSLAGDCPLPPGLPSLIIVS